MIVVTIVLFIIFVCLMYYGYLVVSGLPIPDFWRPSKTKKTADMGPPAPDPNPLISNLTCQFEGEDLYNNQIYTYDGKKVDKSPVISCNQCNQYIFKDESGCAPLLFDPPEDSSICNPSRPDKICLEPHGVCTTSLAPSSKCPF